MNRTTIFFLFIALTYATPTLALRTDNAPISGQCAAGTCLKVRSLRPIHGGALIYQTYCSSDIKTGCMVYTKAAQPLLTQTKKTPIDEPKRMQPCMKVL